VTPPGRPGGADRPSADSPVAGPGERALIVTHADGRTTLEVGAPPDDLVAADGVLVSVTHSSVNYKDALAVSPTGRVAARSPLVPGIDLAGVVVEPGDSAYLPGQAVLAHGYGLGVSRHGGWATVARVPADWLFPLPEGLSAWEAMAIGTAGFTAALSLLELEAAGLDRRSGPVLVTGATGGVGSAAVALLAGRGYEVVASTGKVESERATLKRLGATEVIGRLAAPERPLGRARWAGVVDCVGGPVLARALSELRYGAAAAASGLTGGAELHSSVFPFILRGARLIGVDSAELPMARRREVWAALAAELPWQALRSVTRTVGLEEVPAVVEQLLAGQGVGRTVVRPTDNPPGEPESRPTEA